MTSYQLGSNGQNVKNIQHYCNLYGFTDNAGRKLLEDGKFGELTKEAVIKFQRAASIKQDGIWGPVTEAAAQKWEKTHKVITATAAVNTKPAAQTTVQSTQTGIYNNPRYISNDKQKTGYFCADDMLQEAFYELYGLTIDQSWIAGKAGTTTAGTNHNGVLAAVKAFDNQYKHSINAYFQNFSFLGWKAVGEMVTDPNTFVGMHVLYRDHIGWGHYMTIVQIDMNKQTISCVDTLNQGSALVTVSLLEFEKWIADTPDNQPSVFIAKKIS